MRDRKYSDVYAYRLAIRSDTGPDSATMRHVLLTLSEFMGEDVFCWPSIKTLAAGTALNEKTVRNRLKQAEKQGWIKRGIQGVNGKGWRLYCYVGTIPNHAVLNSAPSVDNSCANSAHAEPHSNIVRAENPTNRS